MEHHVFQRSLDRSFDRLTSFSLQHFQEAWSKVPFDFLDSHEPHLIDSKANRFTFRDVLRCGTSCGQSLLVWVDFRGKVFAEFDVEAKLDLEAA